MHSSTPASGNTSKTQDVNKVQLVKFGHVNIYFIKTETGHILVDAGMPKDKRKLAEAFENAGVDPKTVQLIIATHGHLDHVGTIAYAKQMTGGKVLCHRSYSNDLRVGKAERAVARNLKGHLLGFLTDLMGNKFDGTEPDILMDDQFDLTEYGIGGRIIHTPGHSPSSISILLDNGEALIGDLVRDEGDSKIGPGMFYDDKQTLRESLEKVAAFEPRIIYLSHGTHIDTTLLRNAIEKNM